MRTDMCIDMCMDMYTHMGIDRRADMYTDMLMRRAYGHVCGHVHSQINVCVAMHMGMCADVGACMCLRNARTDTCMDTGHR